LGFNYGSTLAAAEGPPFFIVSGYAGIEGSDYGTARHDAEYVPGARRDFAHHGGSQFPAGSGFPAQSDQHDERNRVERLFCFAPFPLSDSFASFLFGFPWCFSGGGDMNRGLRNFDFAAYGQDEWRVTPRLTINYGLRWEVSTPFTDIRNRMNSWSPGKQSTVFPNAPAGLLFPGDKGVPDGIAPVYWKGLMPRVGLAWDPTVRARPRSARLTESSTTRLPTE
jgi:outer membrane receptor protein involved in Fe transport